MGCGLKLLKSAVAEHATVCKRRFLRHGVTVSCPLGCGREGIRFQDKWAHTTSECESRPRPRPPENTHETFCARALFFFHTLI